MKYILNIAMVMMMTACTSHNIVNNNISAVLEKARGKCDNSTEEMSWLQDLIIHAEKNGQQGNIYAVHLDNETIIIHQPFVMSCLACNLYNCAGEKLDFAHHRTEELLSSLTEKNLIYNPTME